MRGSDIVLQQTGRLTRTAIVAVLCLALGVALAACGSRLDPEEVARANGGVVGGGVAPGGATTGTVGGDTGTTGATGTTGDTGTPGTTGGSTGTTGGATGGGSGGSTGTTGTTKGTGANSAAGATRAGACDGFKNQTGITDKEIVIANASDISGPVPGLFEASQQAVRAYVAYFNSTSDICGRKLKLLTLDSRTDAGADQQAYTRACDEAFAVVGSMSAFDSGGAATTEKCGLPDIRSAGVTEERAACSTCFGAQSTNANQFQNAVPDFVKKYYPEAAKKAAMLYLNAGAAAQNGKNQKAAMTKRGMTFVYEEGIDTSEFNYAPYVQQMKSRGVQYVQFIAAYQQQTRLAQAMKQQGFKPQVYMVDPSAYDPRFVENSGDAAEGVKAFVNFTPFEEASSNKEMQLYLGWLQQVQPGATPSFFGLFSWSAARLFVERSLALGGKLSRATLIDSLRGVRDWTANGLHSPQQVGPRETGQCWRFLTLKGGRWVPEGGTKYSCTGLTQVS